MKTSFAVIGFGALWAFATQIDDFNALRQENAKLLGDATNILKSVKDKASADSAAAKLQPFDDRYAALQKKQADLAKTSPEEHEHYQTWHWGSIATHLQSFGAEMARIEKLPEVMHLLMKKSTMLQKIYGSAAAFEPLLAKAQLQRAQLDVQSLTKAVQVYQIRHGEYPKSLKAMSEGENPLLTKNGYLDPWGNPYQYDPRGPSNNGKKPDIWCTTPKMEVIGNWPEDSVRR
jgi:hypothetical protein